VQLSAGVRRQKGGDALKFGVLVLLFVVPLPGLEAQPCPADPDCEAAGVRTWCEVSLPAIQGITIGSSLVSVREKLGPAEAESEPVYEDTFLTFVMHMEYNGLSLELIKQRDDEVFEVSRIGIRASVWRMNPGLWVGATRAEVVENLGAQDREQVAPSSEILIYELCPWDVTLSVVLTEGRVREIDLRLFWS
jgi:hypothetical protein